MQVINADESINKSIKMWQTIGSVQPNYETFYVSKWYLSGIHHSWFNESFGKKNWQNLTLFGNFPCHERKGNILETHQNIARFDITNMSCKTIVNKAFKFFLQNVLPFTGKIGNWKLL